VRVLLALNSLTNQNIEITISVLTSGNLATRGNKVIEFDKQFDKQMADHLYFDSFVMVSSESPANLDLFKAQFSPSKGRPRLKLGDGVLVPSIAWPTTIWLLTHLALVLILVNVRF
jgi:dTDP-4-amino-4,6-dideoxygalactose transaminase